MENLKQKMRLFVYSLLYSTIFILIPFLLLRFTTVIKDFGWFFLYYLIVNPLSLIVYLFIVKKVFKLNLKFLSILFLIFFLINLPIYIFIYIEVSGAFKGIIGL